MTLKEAERILAEAGVADAGYDALCLAEKATGRSRAMLISDLSDLGEAFDVLVERRRKREPLQYIIGKWWFMDAELTVTPDVLIPRPDTELLASLAAAEMKDGGRLLDVCTGSGCVAIAVLMACPDAAADAIDISKKAVSVAEANAKSNGVGGRMTVSVGDVTKGDGGEYYKVITANPPYVTADEMWSLAPELDFEPTIALTDGGDGLSLIRAIIENYAGRCEALFIEIGSSQGEATARIAEANGCTARVHKDYGGMDRVVEVRKG